MILKINGDIVGNDWKEIYDWFGIECSTPGDVQKALADLPKGDRLQVKINSGDGMTWISRWSPWRRLRRL